MVFVLLVGAVFLSGCQQETVGRNLARNVDISDEGEGMDKTLSYYACRCGSKENASPVPFICLEPCKECCGDAGVAGEAVI